MRWSLLERFLNGSCEPAELAEVERWMAQSPSHRAAVSELARVAASGTEFGNTEAEWERLLARLDVGRERDEP